MIVLYILILLAAPAIAGPGGVRVIAFARDGSVLGTGEGWFITPTGRLLTSRGLLRGAVRAEVSVDGATHCAASVEGDDEDLDLVEIQIEPPQGPLSYIAAGEFKPPANLKRLDLPGAGEIAGWDHVPAAVARAEVRDGKLMHVTRTLTLDGTQLLFLVPAERTLHLTRAGSLSIAGWNAKINRPRALEEIYGNGLALAWTGHYERAASQFEQAVKQDPSYARAWFQLGYARAKLGDSRAKMQAFEKAVAAQPDFGEAHYSLGMGYLLSGNRDAALATAERLRTIDPALAEKLLDLIKMIHVDPVVPKPPLKPVASRLLLRNLALSS